MKLLSLIGFFYLVLGSDSFASSYSSTEPRNFTDAIDFQAIGQERGGGSGTAAEVERATDAFIQMVEDHPELFPRIDPHRLKQQRTNILITYARINVCDKSSSLDAYTDLQTGDTYFNLSQWLKKSWIEKVQLAGHERLVLAGYEPSNRYHISNRVFQVDQQRRIQKYGYQENDCESEFALCQIVDRAKRNVAVFLEKHATGHLAPEDIHHLLRSSQAVNRIMLRTLLGKKELELSRRLFVVNKDQKARRYAERLQLSYDMHVAPIYRNALQSLEQEERRNIECVELSR